ncbi:MAG TPA: zinc dependent phospholipase C family protein [Candidatus Sulfotelmatobacter sp.]|nr:zinc dependent phospholipase C family protein [Candidatus Sulfotelmatobacter sp.]
MKTDWQGNHASWVYTGAVFEANKRICLWAHQNEPVSVGMKITLGIVIVLGAILAAPPVFGYGVLSHEELIDIAWDGEIRPALTRRFPEATVDQLKQAHAYAYGGAVIQDLGYYPFGSHEFTNLLHYVRTGDFVAWMLRDARNLNEYAFAMGALSHYAADIWGHPAVNAGVAIEYPNLRAEFGRMVSYEENPEAHLKTEFSFDVVQVAKKRYISTQYHDFIGFQVSEELLERAFEDTYGIKLDELLHFDDLTIETYRFSVSRVIPEMTQVALATRKDKIQVEKNDAARREFLLHLSRADYERDFGSKYRKPGIFARIVGFFLRMIPKFGPLRSLGYRDPTAQTEDLYFKSMDNVVDQYHREIEKLRGGAAGFPNRNLDTGAVTQAAEYKLADEAYSRLVRRLAHSHFALTTPALRANILAYFASGPAQNNIKPQEWQATQIAPQQLEAETLRGRKQAMSAVHSRSPSERGMF